MKKLQQISAIIGIIILIGMYASTLIFAIVDNSATQGMFKLSIAFTILVPVLLYAFTLFYRLSHPSDTEQSDNDSSESDDEK